MAARSFVAAGAAMGQVIVLADWRRNHQPVQKMHRLPFWPVEWWMAAWGFW